MSEQKTFPTHGNRPELLSDVPFTTEPYSFDSYEVAGFPIADNCNLERLETVLQIARSEVEKLRERKCECGLSTKYGAGTRFLLTFRRYTPSVGTWNLVSLTQESFTNFISTAQYFWDEYTNMSLEEAYTNPSVRLNEYRACLRGETDWSFYDVETGERV